MRIKIVDEQWNYMHETAERCVNVLLEDWHNYIINESGDEHFISANAGRQNSQFRLFVLWIRNITRDKMKPLPSFVVSY